MTIEEVMAAVHKFGLGSHRRTTTYAVEQWHDDAKVEQAIRAALLALVAQARDEEAEACAGIVMAEQATPHGLAYCEAAIRARIASRKVASAGEG